jgi:hypothetical protein
MRVPVNNWGALYTLSIAVLTSSTKQLHNIIYFFLSFEWYDLSPCKTILDFSTRAAF